MAEVLGILGAIYTSAHILNDIASQTTHWSLLSDRLFDIKEGLDAAEVSFKSWQKKYDIQDRRHIIYFHVLFGRLGWDRIRQTLGSIKIVLRTIRKDVDKVVSRALRAESKSSRKGRGRGGDPERYDEKAVQECLRKIKRNLSLSAKFKYSVLGKADGLEKQIDRLHRKLGVLERFSEYYIGREHPEILEGTERLPGRRSIFTIGDARQEVTVQHKILAALSAKKDADLLHKATCKKPQILSTVHIGLAVPQIHTRDFAFLLNLRGESTHELLVHPVTIRSIADSSRISSEIASSIPSLLKNKRDPCYLLPSLSGTDGFEVSLSPHSILADLEYNEPLSSHIDLASNSGSLQLLTSQDQLGLAISIAKGCFRLLGSPWLSFLSTHTLRWRRSATDKTKWTCMLTALPSDAPTTRTLAAAATAAQNRAYGKCDITKEIQVFRIGLVLAELCLREPISYISCSPSSGQVEIYMSGLNMDREPVDAEEVAEEVVRRTLNGMLGDMVYFCLSVLGGKRAQGDDLVEARYFKMVVKEAEQLEAWMKEVGLDNGPGNGKYKGNGNGKARSQVGGGAGTPDREGPRGGGGQRRGKYMY